MRSSINLALSGSYPNATQVAAATTTLYSQILTVGASTAAIAAGLDVTAPPYSATCDGTTDDSTALAACVAASSRNHPCLLPPRTCGTSSYLTLTPGHFLTGWSASSSTLRFNYASGPCSAGAGGLVRFTSTSGGSAYRGLSYLTLQAHTANPGCIANASTASGQVSNIEIDHVTFSDVAGSTGTVGLFMGRNTTLDIHHNYFDTSLAKDIYDQGTFSNGIYTHHNFYDYLIASSTQNFQVELGGASGQVNGCTITDSIFESGPNSINLNTPAGCMVANNYFSDVLSRPSTATWVTVNGGYSAHVGPNYMNSEGTNTKMTCVKVIGSNGVTVEGNMCDSADIAFDLEGSSGTIVKGNTIFFPYTMGVKCSSCTAGEIGVNTEAGNFATGSRFPVYCDGGANSNQITTRYPNPSGFNYTDTCKAENIITNLTDRSFYGLGDITLSKSLMVGPSTNTILRVGVAGAKGVFGRYSLDDGSGTWEFLAYSTSSEHILSVGNGSVAGEGTTDINLINGSLSGGSLFWNSNNNAGAADFRFAGTTYGDLGLLSKAPNSIAAARIKLGYTDGTVPVWIERGGLFCSSCTAGSLTIPGVSISSATGILQSVAVTLASSQTITGGTGTDYSLNASSGIKSGVGFTAPWINARVTPGNVDLSTGTSRITGDGNCTSSSGLCTLSVTSATGASFTVTAPETHTGTTTFRANVEVSSSTLYVDGDKPIAMKVGISSMTLTPTQFSLFSGTTFFVRSDNNSASDVKTGGMVGINTSSPKSTLDVRGPTGNSGSLSGTPGYNIVNIFSNNTAAVGVGGSINLGGENGTGTTPFSFAQLQGYKTTAGSDFGGGFKLYTTSASSTASAQLTVDDRGVVTAPNQPGASVYGYSNTAAPAGVFTTLFWTTALYNNGAGTFISATSSSTFTAPAAGIYMIGCNAGFNNVTTSDTRVQLNITGLSYDCRAGGTTTSAGTHIFCQTLKQLSAGDTFSCSVYTSNAQTLQGSGGAFFQKLW